MRLALYKLKALLVIERKVTLKNQGLRKKFVGNKLGKSSPSKFSVLNNELSKSICLFLGQSVRTHVNSPANRNSLNIYWFFYDHIFFS